MSMSQESKVISEIRKNRKILKDIIMVHHPKFLNRKDDDPRYYNVPFLLEETMAIQGGFEFVDGDHFDFSDGTEAKSATVTLKTVSTKSKNNHRMIISNTISLAGIEKSGDLRVVVYNNVTDALEYFFIPQRDIRALSTIPKKGVPRIEARYNSVTNKIPRLEKYRVSDFVALCACKSTYLNVEITFDNWMFNNTMENTNVCVN